MGKTVFLGVEGSGKTTLMMALAKEFERRKADGFYLKPLSRDSFRFLKMLPEKIGEGTFPHQTASLRDLTWEIEENGVAVGELSVLDYPGEIYRLAFLDAKDEPDPESFRQKVTANKTEIDALLNAVKAAGNIYVLFNLADAEDLGGNARNLDAVWVTNACLHLLKRLESKPAIEILLTQADKYESIGINTASFSLDSIDLIGHDHADVPWSFISAAATHESGYGIDKLIKDIWECQTFRQRAEALRINDFDFNSHYKLIGSDWSSKVALDFFGADTASQVLEEAVAFYSEISRPEKRAILDSEFELGAKISDCESLLACFSKRDLSSKKCGVRLSKADMKASLVGQYVFQSEQGRMQAKNIRAHIDLLFTREGFGSNIAIMFFLIGLILFMAFCVVMAVATKK
ncbi:MAG: hypothetical protein IJQ73_15660 [Kiritimatiellae bacterium]|nr:hypothetical protein [Kiritimatiellia bacterium]